MEHITFSSDTSCCGVFFISISPWIPYTPTAQYLIKDIEWNLSECLVLTHKVRAETAMRDPWNLIRLIPTKGTRENLTLG